MKNIGIVLAIMFSAVFASCQEREGDQAQNQVVQLLQPQKFDDAVKAGKEVQLVDVRTQGEFSTGHLANALNFDIQGAEFEKQVSTLSKDKPVYVYCRSGGRSARAAEQLEKMGFKQVFNMDGGIMAWKAKGLPVQ